jgi:hypothetical protein
MSVYAVIYLILVAIGFGVSAANHGKTTTEDFRSTVIASIISLTLLYKGGFFS